MEGGVCIEWGEMSSILKKVLLQTIGFLSTILLSLTSLSNNPLFSIFITLYSLILLYLPHLFLGLLFSPVLISTLVLLAILLRFGAAQQENREIFLEEIQETCSKPEDPKWVESETEIEHKFELGFDREQHFSEIFVEWNRRGPLEVIYEEYEGEEEDEDSPGNSPERERRQARSDNLAAFSLYYPDSSSGSSSDGVDFPEIEGWDLPENFCFRWEDENDGLIEIPLGGKGKDLAVGQIPVEEENLIEIDLSIVGK